MFRRRKRQKQTLNFFDFPEEVILHILSYLTRAQLLDFSLCCTAARRLALDSSLYLLFFRQKTQGRLAFNATYHHPGSLLRFPALFKGPEEGFRSCFSRNEQRRVPCAGLLVTALLGERGQLDLFIEFENEDLFINRIYFKKGEEHYFLRSEYLSIEKATEYANRSYLARTSFEHAVLCDDFETQLQRLLLKQNPFKENAIGNAKLFLLDLVQSNHYMHHQIIESAFAIFNRHPESKRKKHCGLS